MDETVDRKENNLDSVVSVSSLVGSRDQVVWFQRYLEKRSWGVFYAIWALIIFDFLALHPILAYLFGNSILVQYASSLIDLVSFLLAVFLMHRVFNRSVRIHKLNLTVERVKRSDSFRFLGVRALAVVYIASILLTSLPSFRVPLYITEVVQFLVFTGLLFYMYTSLKWTFNRIPIEGMLAILSLITGSFLAIPFSYFGASQVFFYLEWGPVIFIWIACALISLYSAGEQLEVGYGE